MNFYLICTNYYWFSQLLFRFGGTESKINHWITATTAVVISLTTSTDEPLESMTCYFLLVILIFFRELDCIGLVLFQFPFSYMLHHDVRRIWLNIFWIKMSGMKVAIRAPASSPRNWKQIKTKSIRIEAYISLQYLFLDDSSSGKNCTQ